jgi:3-hydroxyacyl-[acyl-carrier-protein] dehydratase
VQSIIEKILPHRKPFLFVDRVVNFEVGQKIIAEKDLLPGESFFTGHFPGRPIMPGVLVSEALAQASGLLLGLTWGKKGRSMENEKINLFLANIDIKFFTPAKPGDTLRLEATIKKEYGNLFLFKVNTFVGTHPIAEGTLTLSEKK